MKFQDPILVKTWDFWCIIGLKLIAKACNFLSVSPTPCLQITIVEPAVKSVIHSETNHNAPIQVRVDDLIKEFSIGRAGDPSITRISLYLPCYKWFIHSIKNQMKGCMQEKCFRLKIAWQSILGHDRGVFRTPHHMTRALLVMRIFEQKKFNYFSLFLSGRQRNIVGIIIKVVSILANYANLHFCPTRAVHNSSGKVELRAKEGTTHWWASSAVFQRGSI